MFVLLKTRVMVKPGPFSRQVIGFELHAGA